MVIWTFMTTYSIEGANPKPVMTIHGADNTVNANTIAMHSGTVEMLKITPQGFWVRGKLVEHDDKEAEAVYNSFRQWLVASVLTKP